MVEELDIHNRKKRYADFLIIIHNIPDCPSKKILLSYVEWHEIQVAKNKMTHGSALRSLQIAARVVDYFPNLSTISQKALEEWFDKETKRNKLLRTGTGELKETNVPISLESIRKIQVQVSKFFKFVEFLQLDKPIALFNSKRMPVPKLTQFCVADTTKEKIIEPPAVSQEQVKELIDYLISKGNYIDLMCGVVIAVMNDCGLRTSEVLSLKHENIIFQENNCLIQIEQSKTATRTVCVVLARKYLSLWLSQSVTKGSKKELIFCSKNKTLAGYDFLRKRLRLALKEKDLNWKKHSSFHYFRHLCASRLYEMPENLMRYYFGWSGGGMRAVYSAYNWKSCLPYVLKSCKGNPMLDASLNIMEEQTKTKDEIMLEAIREAVKKELKNIK